MFVGYIRQIERWKEQYYNLYKRYSKIYMFATDEERNSTERVKIFNTEKEAEDYVKYTPHTRGFLSWVI